MTQPQRLMCLCAAHSADPMRSRGPLEQTYIDAKSEAIRMSQSFTASAYRETADDALAAWRASQILAETHKTQATELLESLGG